MVFSKVEDDIILSFSELNDLIIEITLHHEFFIVDFREEGLLIRVDGKPSVSFYFVEFFIRQAVCSAGVHVNV